MRRADYKCETCEETVELAGNYPETVYVMCAKCKTDPAVFRRVWSANISIPAGFTGT